MKKYFLILLLAVQTAAVFAIGPLTKGQVLNVWAINGEPLLQGPGLGDKIMNVPYGSAVTIVSTEANRKPFTIAFENPVTKKPYPLQGNWVKVSYNGKQGFVFSGYLSAMPCLKKPKHVENDEAYLQRNYGEPKITNNKNKGNTTRTYKNGAILTESHFDGCVDVKLTLAHTSYQDAILFSKVWLFEGDAANDIKSKTLNNGSIQLSYNACD